MDFGASEENSKTIETLIEDPDCHGPHNKQRPEWVDRFDIKVEGSAEKPGVWNLTAKRVDSRNGWGQRLQYICCAKGANKATPALQLQIPSITMFTPHDERMYQFPLKKDVATDGGLTTTGEGELAQDDDDSFIHVDELIAFINSHKRAAITDITVETINELMQESEKQSTLILKYAQRF